MKKVACLFCSEGLYREISWENLFNFKAIDFDCLCKKCRNQLVKFQINEKNCNACQKCLEKEQGAYIVRTDKKISECVLCERCCKKIKHSADSYLQQDVIYEYNPFLKEWLNTYKNMGDHRLAQVMAHDLDNRYSYYRDYEWLVLAEEDAIYKQRGFHAAALLLEMAGIPYHLPSGYLQSSRSTDEDITLVDLMNEQSHANNATLWKNCKKWVIFSDINYNLTHIIEIRDKLLQAYNHFSLPQPQLVNLVLVRKDESYNQFCTSV